MCDIEEKICKNTGIPIKASVRKFFDNSGTGGGFNGGRVWESVLSKKWKASKEKIEGRVV